jgi:hypothetical protein
VIAALAWLAVVALLVALCLGIKRYERLDDERAHARREKRRRLLAELDRLDQEAEG